MSIGRKRPPPLLRAPTAVLQVEAGALPEEIGGLDGYEAALILARHGAAPIALFVAPVVDAVVKGSVVRAAVARFGSVRLATREALGWLGHSPSPDTESSAATVAVCTRDRPDDLDRCLTALATLASNGHELLVIDSASADNATRRVVERHVGVRYVREDRPGLDVARNRALHEARGEIVAFTDDDAVPDRYWLGALLAGFRDPRTLCVTGLTLPLELETDAQLAFERTNAFSRGLEPRRFDGAVDDPFLVARIGAGVNMAVRKRVLDLVGPFDEALDAGTPTRSGGDHDMFTRILLAGYCIAYEPGAICQHRHRREWTELRETVRGYGTGVYAHLTKHLLRRELRTLAIAVGWGRAQMRNLLRASLRRPGGPPLDLVLAELRGCLAGPFAYRRARREQQEASVPGPLPRVSAESGRSTHDQVDLGPAMVSVIVPTHDRAESLCRLLRGLAADGAALPHEVLVVAAAGDAAAAHAIARTAVPFSVRLLEHGSRGGAAEARNVGARHASGDILLFVDDDIEPFAGMLSEHRRLHEGRPRVVIGAPHAHRPADPGFGELAGWAWWEQQFERIGRRGHRFGYDDVTTGILSMPRELWQSLGGFDESFRCREDFELGLRLMRRRVELTFSERGGGWHHDNRRGTRLVRRKEDEGLADVAIARLHPWAIDSLPLSASVTDKKTAWLRRLAFDHPRVGMIATHVAQHALDLLEALRLRNSWRRLYAGVMYLAYWRGVAAAVGSRAAFATLEEAASASLPEKRVLEIDLSTDPEVLLPQIDYDRPDELRLRAGDVLLGSLAAEPGKEAWRSAHLAEPPAAFLRALGTARALGELRTASAGGSRPVFLDTQSATQLAADRVCTPEDGDATPASFQSSRAVAVDQVDVAGPLEKVHVDADMAPVRILVRAAGMPVAWRWFHAERGIVSVETIGAALPGVFEQLSRCALRLRFSAGRDTELPPVSIVVCTRDRTRSLAHCLDSMARLDYPCYEVVLVDNAPSTDATKQLALQRGVRYVLEPIPGLDRARNRGVAEARHALVAFTDDDARVDPQWLRALVGAFRDDAVGLVTGFVAPGSLVTEAERLFELNYGGMGKGFEPVTLEPQGAAPWRLIETQHLGVGANMAMRRAVLAHIGGFDPALDVGTPAQGGGDLDVFHRILAAGWTAVYQPAAVVWHQHRRSVRDLRRQLFDNGRSFGTYLIVRWKAASLPRRSLAAYAVRWFIWLLGRVPRGLLRRGPMPFSFVLAELIGALCAPYAYVATYTRDRRIHRGAALGQSPRRATEWVG